MIVPACSTTSNTMTLHNSLRTDMVMLAKAGSWCMNSSSCSIWDKMEGERRKQLNRNDQCIPSVPNEKLSDSVTSLLIIRLLPLRCGRVTHKGSAQSNLHIMQPGSVAPFYFPAVAVSFISSHPLCLHPSFPLVFKRPGFNSHSNLRNSWFLFIQFKIPDGWTFI